MLDLHWNWILSFTVLRIEKQLETEFYHSKINFNQHSAQSEIAIISKTQKSKVKI